MRHLAILTLACAVGACSATPAYDADAVQRAAVALVEEWSRAGREGRWADLEALYADERGFAWIERGTVAYDSHATIVAAVRQAAAARIAVDTRVADVVAVPLAADAAAVRAAFTMRLEFSPTQVVERQGVLTGVAVKRDGRWRFLQGSMASREP